ncbi:MAG TPA: hypothetical protein VME47_12740 [Acetobacteraceae bacterium]|nr:hypothetical protein [Acetobacteraceae bacterium]
MISNALTSPAYAYAPDADWAGPDASVRLLHRLPLLYGLVRFLVLVAYLVREYWLAIRQYRAGTQPSSGYSRSDLPPGSAQPPAASICNAFGNTIAWTHRRHDSAPAHKDRLQPFRGVMAFGGSKKGSRPANMNFVDQANVAFGGNLKRFRPHAEAAPVAGRVAFGRSTNGSRPGQPVCGLHSWENPNIVPGAIGGIAEASADPAMALLQSQQKIATAPPQTSGIAARTSAWPVACVPAIRALAEIFPIWHQYQSADRAAAIPGAQSSCV